MLNSQSSPKIVGLTGGIGAGKTTVSKLFDSFGIKVYNADESAKNIMNKDVELRRELISILGPQTYNRGKLNRIWVANKLFNNPSLLDRWNCSVHPKVNQDFACWYEDQKGVYVIKEVAILFETNSQNYYDATILVTAPSALRTQRAMNRNQLSLRDVENRMRFQWPDNKKISLADYVIENVDLDCTKDQVIRLHRELSQRFAQQ